VAVEAQRRKQEAERQQKLEEERKKEVPREQEAERLGNKGTTRTCNSPFGDFQVACPSGWEMSQTSEGTHYREVYYKPPSTSDLFIDIRWYSYSYPHRLPHGLLVMYHSAEDFIDQTSSRSYFGGESIAPTIESTMTSAGQVKSFVIAWGDVLGRKTHIEQLGDLVYKMATEERSSDGGLLDPGFHAAYTLHAYTVLSRNQGFYVFLYGAPISSFSQHLNDYETVVSTLELTPAADASSSNNATNLLPTDREPFKVRATWSSPREALRDLLPVMQTTCNDSFESEKCQLMLAETVRLAAQVNPRPAVPEEAEKLAGAAELMLRTAKSVEDYAAAGAKYGKALLIAPWVAAYFFNHATLEEKAGEVTNGKASLELYLLAAPDATDASEVRKRIGGLDYLLEKKRKATDLSGEMDRNGLYARGGVSLAFELPGGSIRTRRISLKILTRLQNGALVEKLGVFDFTEGGSIDGNVIDLLPIQKVVTLNGIEFLLVLRADGAIEFGLASSTAPEIKTSTSELYRKRRDQILSEGPLIQKYRKYFRYIGQGGSTAYHLYFSADEAGNIIGDGDTVKPSFVDIYNKETGSFDVQDGGIPE